MATHLLLRDGVVGEDQVRQTGELGQHVEVRQLGNIVGRQHQVLQVGDGLGQAHLDAGDAVSRQQQRLDARRQREVAQHLDVVVCEVDGIVGLRDGHKHAVVSQRSTPARGDGVRARAPHEERGKGGKLTPATPRFSMAGILCPVPRATTTTFASTLKLFL